MDDLLFTIEEWDAEGLRRVETLARVTNALIGRVAYDAAAAHILFRHGIRVGSFFSCHRYIGLLAVIHPAHCPPVMTSRWFS
jgi:hypothetical protein